MNANKQIKLFIKLTLYFVIFVLAAYLISFQYYQFTGQEFSPRTTWIEIHDVYLLFILWRFAPVIWGISLTQRFFLNDGLKEKMFYFNFVVPFLAGIQLIFGNLYNIFEGIPIESPLELLITFSIGYLVILFYNHIFIDPKTSTDIIKDSPRILKEITLLFLIVTNIGFISQFLGGCVWYLPILDSVYTWNRYGSGVITSEFWLTIFYLVTASAVTWYTVDFYKKYFLVDKQKHAYNYRVHQKRA